MTREEAIQILSTRDAHGVLCGYTSGVTEALDMAIKSLSADTVSRSQYQGLLNAIGKVYVEVVRCKDCRHYEFADNRAFGMPVKYCDWFGFEDVDDDDFCSRGERKEP